MDMFVGLGAIGTFCMWNVFAIVGIIASLRWVIKKYNKKDDSGEYILDPKILKEWLSEKQVEGYNTVDDLIKQFAVKEVEPEVKVKNEEIEEELNIPTFSVTPKPDDLDVKQVEREIPGSSPRMTNIPNKETKSLIDNFSASVLLYLGAALIIFAVFVFIAFTWDSYANLTKSLLIIVFTLSMYAAGIVFTVNKRLRQAGLSFLFIASILFGFLGVGLWNFLFLELFPEGFHIYWLVWSLFMTTTYGVTLYLLKLKQYFYFLIFAIYSTFYSFAYTVGSDINLRIVVFLALNFSFYLAISQIKTQYTDFTKITSRIINSILNFFVFLSVVAIATQIDSTLEKVMASIALLIPTAFAITVLFKEKSSAESAVELLFLPLKILIFSSIFNLTTEVLLLLIFLYATTTTVLFDIFTTKKLKVLAGFAKATTWLTTIASTLFFFTLWVIQKHNGFAFNGNIQALLIIGFGLILILPEIHKRNKVLFSIALTYPIFAITRLLNIFYPEARDLDYILILLAFAYTLTTAVIFFYQKNYKGKAAMLLPTIVLTSTIVLMITITAGGKLNIATGFGLVSLIMMLLSATYKKPWLMAVSVPLILGTYGTTLNLIDDNVTASLTEDGLMGIWFLIPIFIYAFLFENAYFNKKKAYPYMFGFLLFTFFGYLSAMETQITLFDYFGILTMYGIYAIMRFKHSAAIIFISALATFMLWAGLGLFDLPRHSGLFTTATLWLGFNVVGYLAETYLDKSSDTATLKLFSTISTVLMPFIILSMLGNIGAAISSLYIFTGMVVFINLLLSDRLHNIFGNIAGVSIIFTLWHIAIHYDAAAQFFIIPVTLYLAILALRYHLKNNHGIMTFFKYSALILQFTSLLLQSMVEPGNDRLWFGFLLIILAIITLLIALYRKDNKLMYFSLVYIFIELFIRLYVFIVKIPWWIYLGLTGLGIMGIAVYILWKLGEKKN